MLYKHSRLLVVVASWHYALQDSIAAWQIVVNFKTTGEMRMIAASQARSLANKYLRSVRQAKAPCQAVLP
jgi:hypothetical protein